MVSASSISDDVYFSTLEQEQSAQFLHAAVQNIVLHPQNITGMYNVTIYFVTLRYKNVLIHIYIYNNVIYYSVIYIPEILNS